METLLETGRYMLANLSYIGALAGQHLTLVGVAVSLAVLLGVPLGVVIVRFPAAANVVLSLATVLLTIPAIALFIFAWMHFGFGENPARAAVCGALTALMCWGLFHELLAVAWPQSLLGDLFPALRDALGFI